MGDWRTGLSLKLDPTEGNWRYAPGFHPSRRKHREDPLCNSAHCHFLVRQHQGFQKPEDSDVPQFTIEVAYKTEDRIGNSLDLGWRYLIKWMESGSPKCKRGYGFASKEGAVDVAKREADAIAKSLLPVHVETYTPEV